LYYDCVVFLAVLTVGDGMGDENTAERSSRLEQVFNELYRGRKAPAALLPLSIRIEEILMRIVRVLHKNRAPIAVGLLGLLVATSGCGGNTGESTVAGTTPPPGQSGKEIADAMKNAYGPTGVPKIEKGAPKVKAP
jgi:hypothetical protein